MNKYDIQKIIDLYKMYSSVAKIASMLTTSQEKIRRILIDNGVVCSYKQQRVCKLKEQGYSCLQISEMFGITLDKVYDYFPTNKYKLENKE